MANLNWNGGGGGGSGGFRIPQGLSLANTVHSEIATSLPLPSLPVFCGALDQDLRLFDDKTAGSSRSLNRKEVLKQAGKISDLLRNTDVSYLNFKGEVPVNSDFTGHLDLYDEVLRQCPEAFEYASPGLARESISRIKPVESRFDEQIKHVTNNNTERDVTEIKHDRHDSLIGSDPISSSKKRKTKKKGNDDNMSDGLHAKENQVLKRFCMMVNDFCGRAEVENDENNESEWLHMSVSDIRTVLNEVLSVKAKNALHLVPGDILERLLKVLDNQIHHSVGLSMIECENSDADVASSISGALECIHAVLAIMAHNNMPKQLYKEEIIDRIVDFSRHQIMDVMLTYDPSFRAMHKPNDNGTLDDEEDEDAAGEFGAASKKKRTSKGGKVRKSVTNKVSGTMNVILQKLCTILGFLRDLLSIERLADSCILQLVRTCLTTFLVDNVQLLQLKALSLISGVYYTYNQHRPYIMDEALQVMLKLPSSKRATRSYHLPDEEQRQIQLISALLLQLIQCSADLPELLRQSFGDPSLEVTIGPTYPIDCHVSVTDSCCLFWSRVLQRFTNTKSQDISDLKTMLENLLMDLLSTLNLPEYPASASLLEVLCVLLLQNYGLKSKDIGLRSMAIDLLGSIAARLKQDAVLCNKQQFWIVKELRGGNVEDCQTSRVCSICLDTRTDKSLLVCQLCQKLYHADCLGVRESEVSVRNFCCQICLCKKQLLFLKSNCESHDEEKESSRNNGVANLEILQQMLLNYLEDVGSADDLHIFTRWFYLCLWYKDDPDAQEKFGYYLERLKAKAVVRDSSVSGCLLTRDAVKKITLALGQSNSFSRGFDKILQLLLASLRENSPVIRAKALRAVSIIVEADPEVLCDKLVQTAVEGRFNDQAISVREAALELVGRHIASHPDVGLKYFEKVAERTKDTGVSVRKRAIRIIKDMCTSNANFTEFTAACIEIISRINDDESSIQDLVCKTFYEFWFEELPNSQSYVFGDGSSVSIELVKKTEQIVEMLRMMSSHQLLVVVIKRNLALDFFPQSAKAVGINPILIASVRRRCELMCKCLLEKVLQVVEANSVEGERRMLPYILLLHTFCVVDPTLCAPASDPSQFVVTLQPYLKSQADNRLAATLLESIIFIIDSILPLLRKLPQTAVEELEQDLKQMIVRHPFLTVVHACIKCLCSVSRVAGKGANIIEYLILLFYKRLEALGFTNVQQVGRSLFCLGLLIRYGTSLLSASSANKNIDITRSVNMFKKCLDAEDFVIKVRSLQALGHVLIAWPEFMLDKDIGNMLEDTLSSSIDARLKMQSLQNIYEYLLDAEKQMGVVPANKEEVNGSADGGHSVPVAAGAGDTNICGGIVQLYWDAILGRSLDANEEVRQLALKIVEVVLRQGLVHPITCVPYLIALETDPLGGNSKLAHHLLMNMNDKYPAFIESRLGDGLQLSFEFIQSMNQIFPENNSIKTSKVAGLYSGKSDSGSSYASQAVTRIYKLIRGNRVSRNKFMASVVRKFDSPNWNAKTFPFLVYCTEILASLPFTLPDEPLYLIYSINRVLQVRAGTLETNMKADLQLLQGDGQKTNGNGMVQLDTCPQSGLNNLSIDVNQLVPEDLPDLGGEAKFVVENMNETTGRFYLFSKDDLQKIQIDFLSAGALQLLLKLKRHLKIVFGLNDARCQAFSPNEPPKPGEHLSRQKIPLNVGELNPSPPCSYEDFLQRYQEFKNALKEDTVDYSTYTANIKKKRPSSRKSGKSCQGRGVEEDDDGDNDEDFKIKARLSSGGRKSSRTTRYQF